jgi:capsular polysaccharide transport system ATP-binding protein
VLDRITVDFDPSDHYVIFGVRGSGKSTLLRVISGVSPPTAGSVTRGCSVSLPNGYSQGIGAFKTCRDIAKLLAELYHADPDEVARFVETFSGLGDVFDHPVASLTPEMRGHLTYALAYGVPAQVLLFDNAISYGDKHFRANCLKAFRRRCETSGSILATRNPRSVVDGAQKGAVLVDGALHFFDSVQEAASVHEQLQLADAQSALSYAEKLVSNGQAEDAQRYLREHLRENEDIPEAYELFARLSLRVGKYDDVKLAARIAAERVPEAAWTHLLAANAAEKEGQFQEALSYASMALKLDAGSREAKVIMARSYEGMEAYREAGEIWAGLAGNQKDQASTNLAIRNFSRANDWRSVLQTLDSAPDDIALRQTELRARALIELEEWEGAKEAIALLLARDAGRASSLLLRLARSELFMPKALEFLDSLPLHHLREVNTPSRWALVAFVNQRAVAAAADTNPGLLETAKRLLSIFGPSGDGAIKEATERPKEQAAVPDRERDLSSTNGIIRELYELRARRPEMDAEEYGVRSKAAWIAAKSVMGKTTDDDDT